MVDKKNTTERPTLNRSGAKGVDVNGFVLRQTILGLAPALYYGVLQVNHLDGPLFPAAAPDVRDHFMELAEAVVRMDLPVGLKPAPVQPMVPHCMPRNLRLTHIPPTVGGGKVLMMIEPNQRPA